MRNRNPLRALGARTRTLAYAALLACGLLASSKASADVELTLEQLPEAVRKTAVAEVGNGVIDEIERETKRGRVVYEVEFILDNIEYELDIAEDGTLLRRHRD